VQFAVQGCKVAFVDLEQEAGQALEGRFAERTWFRCCDVTDVVALQTAVRDAAAAMGPITILVNSVANDTRHDAADISIDTWRKGLAVNLDPAFAASVAVYPMMKAAGGGSIINVSSINALWGPVILPRKSGRG